MERVSYAHEFPLSAISAETLLEPEEVHVLETLYNVCLTPETRYKD